jgi:NAD(P)-dependent dehydrogenase (short-subunit alcohol dehydrogenase family)
MPTLEHSDRSVWLKVKEFFFNIWCMICLYTLGAFYMTVELNRKICLFGKVRKLDVDTELPTSLTGNVAIITGGSRGIGWEAGKVLLNKGCHVIIGTSVQPGHALNQLREKLNRDAGKEYKGRLELWHLNLTSMDSVVEFADKFIKSGYHLNVLINNAGIMYAPFKLTGDKFESHWIVNYLAHCLLVSLLLPKLESTGAKCGLRSRIVNVSSSTHFARSLNLSDLNGLKMYSPYHAYGQSKLAQIMYTYKLHEVLSDSEEYSNVSVTCLHPGVAKTELYEHVWWVVAFPWVSDLLFRTAKEGAETVLYAAFSSELEGVGGKYLEDSAIMRSSCYSYDKDAQSGLWTATGHSLSNWLDKQSQLFNTPSE